MESECFHWEVVAVSTCGMWLPTWMIASHRLLGEPSRKFIRGALKKRQCVAWLRLGMSVVVARAQNRWYHGSHRPRRRAALLLFAFRKRRPAQVRLPFHEVSSFSLFPSRYVGHNLFRRLWAGSLIAGTARERAMKWTKPDTTRMSDLVELWESAVLSALGESPPSKFLSLNLQAISAIMA